MAKSALGRRDGLRQGCRRPAWVATACQGVGASIWWPCKDQQADEVDSMLISISRAHGLEGRIKRPPARHQKLPDGYVRYDWAVRNPINNYDVALNVGNYVHFSDVYAGRKRPADARLLGIARKFGKGQNALRRQRAAHAQEYGSVVRPLPLLCGRLQAHRGPTPGHGAPERHRLRQ
ncbi:MAG: hypothetical protein WKG07_35120 [Hymenobacter sp.]